MGFYYWSLHSSRQGLSVWMIKYKILLKMKNNFEPSNTRLTTALSPIFYKHQAIKSRHESAVIFIQQPTWLNVVGRRLVLGSSSRQSLTECQYVLSPRIPIRIILESNRTGMWNRLYRNSKKISFNNSDLGDKFENKF